MHFSSYDEFLEDMPRIPQRTLNLLSVAQGKIKAEVAKTPYEVIARFGRVRLLKFQSNGTQEKSPVLLVPSIINKYYIFDLQPGKSMVEHLANEGITAYVVDWGTPGPQDEYRTLSDHILGWLHAAVRHACRDAGLPKIHMLGYCLGGTFSTIYTALRPERIASLMCLSSPVNFHDEGILSCWASNPEFDVKYLQKKMGNIPHELLQSSFSLLIPTSQFTKPLHFAQGSWNKDFSLNFLALEAWLDDNVDFPGASYVEYIERLYRKNELIEGKFDLNGEKVDLANITVPVMSLLATKDHIVPPESSRLLHDKISSTDSEVHTFKSGHIGITIGRKAKAGMWKDVENWITKRPIQRIDA